MTSEPSAYARHPEGQALADVPEPRPVQDRETVFSGAIWDVVAETFRMHAEGDPLRREYVQHPGAVAVVALDEQQRLCVIRQYRHPVGQELWEIPAGLLDVEGEPMLAAAQRELAEEVDLRAERWEVLADLFTSPGSSTEGIRVYLARELTPVPEDERHERQAEEQDMPVAWVPLTEAAQGVLAGRLHNPTLCLGVLAAQLQAAQGFDQVRPADAPWEGHPRRPSTA